MSEARATRPNPALERFDNRAPRRLAWIAAAAFSLAPASVVVGQEPPDSDAGATASTYDAATAGTRVLENAGGLTIKVLVEASNLGGGEAEVAEITFPPGYGENAQPHTHGRTEIFYVLDGTLGHVVNGESHVVEPGMVGIVRAGDTVIHRVAGDSPVRALVIWAPAGELDRIAPGLDERPIP